MSKRSLFVLVCVVALAWLVLAACGGDDEEPTPAAPAVEAPAKAVAQPTKEEVKPTEAPAAPTPEPELVGDSIRGGVLYDAWWPVLGVDVPEGDQALWATQTTNTRSGGDTWRCKECHGWDYKGADGAYGSGSHATGFVGVMDAAAQGATFVLGALKGATNPDHDFSAVLDDQSLTDLALFIADETKDYGVFIASDKLAVGGDVAVGEPLFQDNCSDCHGPQGMAVNFSDESGPEYIGTLASDNPWEFIHKARSGQPGVAEMPSAIDLGWSDEELASVLTYAQSLPTSSPVSEGGILYDKWWTAIGADVPEGDQPLWATQTTNTRSGADTWRCKECHGWDYKGADGVYGAGSHATGFAGILAAATKPAEELAAALTGATNQDHDFSSYLSEDQIGMLVAFMQEGVLDSVPFINEDKSVNGDDANGKSLFNATCKRCHGENGTDLMFGDESNPEYVGTIASDNPWEFFHKISFGQPGEHMPATVNLGWSSQDIADVLKYAQSLPTEKK